MIQKDFAKKVVQIIKKDKSVIGLAAGGSWIKNEMDEFSDLDLILVTSKIISGNKKKMFEYARKFGNLLTGFTGEHIGDTRVLICLYDKPLLHVDIKFLTLEEFHKRVEDPEILFERENKLTKIINSTKAVWPDHGFQWYEDRFWIWVHYLAAKIGRGEYFEALDGLSFLRNQVISNMLHNKYEKLPRRLRRIEFTVNKKILEKLKSSVAQYDHDSILEALHSIIDIYKTLRKKLYSSEIILRSEAEKKSLRYLKSMN